MVLCYDCTHIKSEGLHFAISFFPTSTSHIQYVFLTIPSTELIANPGAHSIGWQSAVLYVDLGLFPPCSIICNEAILFLNNMRKLIHACFFFKG